jgi:PA14 domain-containing protein
MRIMMILFTVMVLFVGCAKGPKGDQGGQGVQGSPGSTVTVVAPTPAAPDATQAVVDGYNAYRLSIGQDPITPGLSCTLYSIANMPATPCLLSTSIVGCTVLSSTVGYTNQGSWTYTGTIDQVDQAGTSGFSLLPTALQSLYATNFAVTCTGYFVNPDYGYHEFDTNSDDGSLLYLNGGLVVNNDGLHAIQDVKATKYLQAQMYSLQVNYFQGPGYVALIVNEDGAPLPAGALWH